MFIRPADGEHVAMASPMTVVTDNFADLPRRHYEVIVADPTVVVRLVDGQREDPRRHHPAEGNSRQGLRDHDAGRDLRAAGGVDRREELRVVLVGRQQPAAPGYRARPRLELRLQDDRFRLGEVELHTPWPLHGHGQLDKAERGDVPAVHSRDSRVERAPAYGRTIIAPRREHSRKPPEVLDRIEELLPGPFIELFARGAPRSGWSAWGDEVEAPQLAVAAE